MSDTTLESNQPGMNTNVAPTQQRMKKGETKDQMHRRLLGYFLQECARQASNRSLAARCEAFYDSEQWDSEDAKIIQKRGQNPVVYNEVKTTIDWMIGSERRSRVDFIVVAEDEGPEADEDARAKTKLLKYLDSTNKAEFERSYSVEDQLKAGLGWLEVGLRADESGPLVLVQAESWRNIVYDSHAQRRDLTDARYLFRVKVVDFDVALAAFPDDEQALQRVMQTGDNKTALTTWMGDFGVLQGLDHFQGTGNPEDHNQVNPVDLWNPRERVMLIEAWTREPVPVKQEQGSMGDPVSWEIHCTIMTQSDVLLSARSPYNHDRFPFVPVWAYRNRRTGMAYGPIFPMLGPQTALNQRMSRSLFEAAKNQIKIEHSAIDPAVMDIEAIRAEFDDPSGIAIFANGALSGGKVQERDDEGRAHKQLALAERDIMHLRQTSGVTSENRGLDTNAMSGKAILAKADQGGLLTAELFDNQLFARQLEGELKLSLAEQYMTQPRSIRVPGDQVERLTINQPTPAGGKRNDIAARHAHFVIGEQQWKQSYAEAAFDQLMQVFTQLASAAPNVVVAMLDVLFEMHPNLPKKSLILQRIRSVTGQSDPDGKVSPEQQQAKAQEQQRAQAQFDAEMAQLKASVREAEARGEKLSAEATRQRLESVYMAAQAAQVAVQVPATMPVADQLLKSAGFVDADGGDMAQVPAPDADMAQPMPQEQQMAMPEQPIPELLQADGAMQGIETPEPDGVLPQQGEIT